MTVDELRKIAQGGDRRRDPSWVDHLENRTQKESEFHDEKHRGHQAAQQNAAMDTYEAIYTNRKYYRAVGTCVNCAERWLVTEARGNGFIDYCCGIHPRRRGEHPSARQFRRPHHLQRRAASPRHFLRLPVTAPHPQAGRPGSRGRGAGLQSRHQALPHEHAKHPYGVGRAHILSLKDVMFARRFFDVENFRFWHITAIAGPHLLSFALPVLHGIDRALICLPGVQLRLRFFTFEMVKPLDTPKH